MSTKDAADALESLRVLRLQATMRVERIDSAIQLLSNLDAPIPQHRRGASVRTRLLEVLEEGPRTWTPEEIVDELDQRGTPLDVRQPQKQAQTALALLYREGLADRVAPNTYKAISAETSGDEVEVV